GVAQQLLGGGGGEVRDAFVGAGDVALGDAGLGKNLLCAPADIGRELGVGDDARGELAADGGDGGPAVGAHGGRAFSSAQAGFVTSAWRSARVAQRSSASASRMR